MSPSVYPCEDIDLLPVSLGETAPPEVMTHLDRCASCQRRLDALRAELRNVRQAADSLSTETALNHTHRAASLRDLPGAIGKYYVLGVLGGGGQATVYHVLHPELHRELVIKVASEPSGADERGRELLVHEGRVLAELDHPGLARVHDLGFHEGRPYLVMEYVRGVTLEQYAQARRLAPREAAALVAQVARALGVAHRRGVIHQDIKPANVVIDEAGRPRVIDFGLARLRGAWTGEAPQPAGGTAAFMAPEQARMEEDRVGPASDVFALGGLLYFLLTRRQLFSGANWKEALDRAGRCDFDRAALRAARVPRGLEAICLKALAAESAGRYPDADAFAGALERYVAGPRRLLRWGAVAAVVIVLLLGGWLWRQALVQPPEDARPQVLKEDPLRPSQVQRGGALLTLDSALPLQEGDKIHLECALPPDVKVALFWFDTEGDLAELGGTEVKAGRLHFPADAKVAPLKGPPGTEFVLVCGGRAGAPSLKEVRQLLGSGPLPPLPKGVKSVAVNDKDVRVHTKREVGAPERGVVGPLVERLEALRQGLRQRYEFVAGLAFPRQ